MGTMIHFDKWKFIDLGYTKDKWRDFHRDIFDGTYPEAMEWLCKPKSLARLLFYPVSLLVALSFTVFLLLAVFIMYFLLSIILTINCVISLFSLLNCVRW